MPIHDWPRVDAGTFHDFHESWIGELKRALNRGLLPPGYFAMADQVVSGPTPDVVTLKLTGEEEPISEEALGIAVATAPPRVRHVTRGEREVYTKKANRIAIRHKRGRVIAVVEVVSPGNKDSRHSLRALVDKVTELLRAGIHLLIVDLFPPSKRDPQGIHKAIWDEIEEEPFELPPDKPLTLAAYSAGLPKVAYVESVGVGDPLPDMPLFLIPERYIPVPLEATYQAAWSNFPDLLKPLLEQPPA